MKPKTNRDAVSVTSAISSIVPGGVIEMHGTIFFHLQRFAEQVLGPGGWTRLFDEAGMAVKTYSPATAHADEDIVALVKAACSLTKLSPVEVLRACGEYLAPELLSLYPQPIKPNWRTLDVLSNTEQVIHLVVRAKNPDATPPVLRAQRISHDQVHLVYASPRQLCPWAHRKTPNSRESGY